MYLRDKSCIAPVEESVLETKRSSNGSDFDSGAPGEVFFKLRGGILGEDSNNKA